MGVDFVDREAELPDPTSTGRWRYHSEVDLRASQLATSARRIPGRLLRQA